MLTAAGILTVRVEGRQTYFTANAGCEFLVELRLLLQKLAGPEAQLIEELGKHGRRIRVGFLHSRNAATSKMSLVVVSTANEKMLRSSVGRVEDRLGVQVELQHFRLSDLGRAAKSGVFRRLINYRTKVWLIGSQPEALKLLKQK